MSENRIYKYQYVKDLSEITKEDTYILLDRGNWKKERSLSLSQLQDTIEINLENNIREKNVTSIKPLDIEQAPLKSPQIHSNLQSTYISVDENYLYVWIPQLQRWKRILMSEWN